MGKPTSRDVADVLGIAQSTVSRAFTPGASISPPLRERIHAAAARIGYRPNLLARGLVAGRSRLVGMVIAPQTNLLHPELIYEFGRRLAGRDHHLLLLPAADEKTAAEAVGRLHAYRVDAIVGTGALGEAAARAVVGEGVPLVTYNRLIDGVPGVSGDFAGGAAELAARLLAAGHRSFGFVGGPMGSWVSERALAGWRAALSGSAGVTQGEISVPYRYEDGEDAIVRLSAAAGRVPDAILCVSDTVAAGCLDHLRRRLRRDVPGEVAVVTFLSRDAGRWAEYAMTGLVQPLEAMIEHVLVRLVGTAGNLDHEASHRLFPMRLVHGATAAVDRASPQGQDQ